MIAFHGSCPVIIQLPIADRDSQEITEEFFCSFMRSAFAEKLQRFFRFEQHEIVREPFFKQLRERLFHTVFDPERYRALFNGRRAFQTGA